MIKYIIAFFLLCVLIAINWNKELFIRKNKLNKYIYNKRYKQLQEKGYFSDKYWAKIYAIQNIPECKVAKLIYRTKNPEKLLNLDLPEKCFIKGTTRSGYTIHYKKDSNPKKEEKNRRKIVKRCRNFLKSMSKTTLNILKFLKLDEPQYEYNDTSIIIEEKIDARREIEVHMIKNKIAFIIEKDSNRKLIRNIYDNTGKIMPKKMAYHSEIALYDRKQLANFQTIKKICERFQNKFMFDYVRIDFIKTPNDLYFCEFTFTSNIAIGKLSPNLDKYLQENFLRFSN